ncbi:DUF5590 domain-containing protein [Alteribacter keqinensis]|uniref:Uncharacterized protein n=1 Tax=Alteribacter keqinensis TaxID=2483800 RepID=A0A3M7TU66_9BACI|nr:DUF5590 domain-containing protein [Alteribacter keqinensis]RNA69178.1 hypothetical protein EBO34_04300 [Alteribacter keqinensis]
MKRWIIGTAIFLLSTAAVTMIWLYNNIQSAQHERFGDSIAYAMDEGLISDYGNVHYYNGRTAYHVIEGTSPDGDAVYVWVETIPESTENYSSAFDEEDSESEENPASEPRTFSRKQDEGISAGEARQIAEANLEMEKFKQVRLGMIGQTPVYEIVYVDTDDRYSFYYISFEDGDYIRHYQLRRSA